MSERTSTPKSRSAWDRFWAKVDASGDCWEWTASKNNTGYGTFRLNSKTATAHVLAYEWLVGPVAQGLDLDHLCRNRACVNPDHLDPVSHRTNVLRGVSFSAVNAAKTHCNSGHEFTPANTHIEGRAGGRRCRACDRVKKAKKAKKTRRAA